VAVAVIVCDPVLHRCCEGLGPHDTHLVGTHAEVRLVELLPAKKCIWIWLVVRNVVAQLVVRVGDALRAGGDSGV
jgi:hypothetical protein